MKQSTLKPISSKRQGQIADYIALKIQLLALNNCLDTMRGPSEWNGEIGQLELHHIDGRQGKRLSDPFNVILITRDQHLAFHRHNSWEVKQALKLWVYGIRIRQGFIENKEG